MKKYSVLRLFATLSYIAAALVMLGVVALVVLIQIGDDPDVIVTTVVLVIGSWQALCVAALGQLCNLMCDVAASNQIVADIHVAAYKRKLGKRGSTQDFAQLTERKRIKRISDGN